MKIHEIFILFFVIFVISSSKKDKDIQEFFKGKNCDPKCTFNSTNLTKRNMHFFPKSCNQICAEISLNDKTDLSEQELIFLFQNVKSIIGILNIISTKYANLKFLEGLEAVECFDDSEVSILLNYEMTELGLGSLTEVNCDGFSVKVNEKLKILNMPDIKKMKNPTKPNKEVYVGIADNSNSFCISPLEMYNFLEIPTAGVDQIYADSYCKMDTICTKLSKNCIWILGDVKITTNCDLENMKSVEAIFGGITISGTNITDFSFLETLKYVAQLEHKPAVVIENIPNLMNVTFPKLKRVKSDSSYTMEFENVNPIFTLNSTYCYEIRKSLGLSDWAPKFDGFSCEDLDSNHDYIVQNQKKKSENRNGIGAFLIMILYLFI
ncbi:hypothetical protein L3Y34_006997 [Caenorhabditis briggsae]|uniref:Receptor L-domain domain-containing protein n=2 Tax=Caenorhabditis briggsae TaxID=6238 RepID=A0AAE9CZI6_CAEBR|nr:hypothetical protein L3Y34_006997 [Caenorhabditis briggsae]